MRFGLVGPSYMSQSTAVADEETINWYIETMESQGSIAPSSSYGGKTAATIRSLFGTPGLGLWATLPQKPVRGSCWTGSRRFFVGGGQLWEMSSGAVPTLRGVVANDGTPVSFTFSGVDVLLISAGRAYNFHLATNVLTDVTGSLAGVPVKAEYQGGYFIAIFQNSNQYQFSALFDGTTWPGIQVNAVSVFQENINSIISNHNELWIFGNLHAQPYQDTGSVEVFDIVQGIMLEKGSGATFGPCRVDNSVFWVGQDERGSFGCWRSNNYTPQRVSTYAVETDLTSFGSIAGMVTYSYESRGHLFWVLYLPGSQWSWVFDVKEQLWHKRASWNGAVWGPHWSWNHIFCDGKHLVGDWNSGNIYWMDDQFLDDNGTAIGAYRRSPIVTEEMEWIYHAQLVLDFDTGLAPQPPLLDGAGNPRQPQVMLRWSDDRGKTWSNVYTIDLGFAGQYKTRVIKRRLGRSRYRIYEISMTDKVKRVLVDGYVKDSVAA